jgi:hypothetical protein
MKRLLLILTLLAFGNSFAQWNTDTTINTLVVDSVSGDMKELSTSGDKIYAQNFADEDLGVDDHDSPIQILFVNPIPKQLEIVSNLTLESISVYSTIGQLIFSEDIHGEHNIRLNTNLWQMGIYFMKVATVDGQSKVFKLIKN